MGYVIDHLAADRRVTVLEDFIDARGAAHRAGETAILRRLALDWPRREIRMDWERGGAAETLVFDLDSPAGPGNGRMRRYFEVGDYAPQPRPPSPAAEPGHDPVSRVAALAVRGDTAAAERLLRSLDDDPESLAAALTAAAERHAGCDWLRDEAVNAWYHWGSQATSGGDGAARLLIMRPALARLKRLEK